MRIRKLVTIIMASNIRSKRNKQRVWDEVYDFNPKSWISPFRKSNIAYLSKMFVFYHIIAYGLSLLSIFIPRLYLEGVPDFDIPGNILTTTIFSPIFEEAVFFGIPYYLTGNNFLILLIGLIWSVLHILKDNVPFVNLPVATFLATIPILFFNLRTWISKKGWFSIATHIGFNSFVILIECLPLNFACRDLQNLSFDHVNFQIFAGISMVVLITNYFIYKKNHNKLEAYNFKLKEIMSKRWNKFLIGYGISIVIFTFWIVVLGTLRDEIIPYITKCTEGSPCDLTNLGALTVGILITSFIACLILKIQKDHAEDLTKVSRSVTEKVYSKVRTYTCDIMYEEFEDSDPQDAKQKAMSAAQKWLEKIEDLAIGSIEELEVPGRGKAHRIVLEEGPVIITVPQSSRQYYGKYTQAARLHIKTDNGNVFDKILTLNEKPYWDLQWNIADKIDVRNLISKLYEKQGKSPGDQSISREEEKEWSQATYHIITINGISIVATLADKKDNTTTISLTCQSRKPDEGFYQAHKIFSPGKILSALFGEIPFSEVRSMFQKSLKK